MKDFKAIKNVLMGIGLPFGLVGLFVALGLMYLNGMFSRGGHVRVVRDWAVPSPSEWSSGLTNEVCRNHAAFWVRSAR